MKKVLFFLFVSCIICINADQTKNNKQASRHSSKNKEVVSLHCGAGTKPSCTKVGKRNFKCVCKPIK